MASRACAAAAIALTAVLASAPAEAQLGVGGLQRSDANRDEMRIAGWWGGPVRDVAVEGDVAVCAIGTRVVVLDVSDKNNPQRTDEIDFGFIVRDVELRDGYAYAVTSHMLMAGNTRQFSIIDVRNPGSAEVVYFSPPRGAGGKWGGSESLQYQAVELYGPYALVLTDGHEIEVYNIAVPEAASFVEHCTWSQSLNPSDLVVDGDYIYFLDDRPGDTDSINIYDLSFDPLNPPLIASVPTDGNLDAIAVEDSYLAVVDGANGFVRLFDISDRTNPNQIGTTSGFAGNLSGVSISNGYLCIGDRASVGWNGGEPWWNQVNGLSIYDIWNDPTLSDLPETFKTHGATRGVVAVGTTAYTFDDGEGLVLIDIDMKNHDEPVRLGAYYSPAALRQMTKVGDHLYVTDEWNGFTILNVSAPARPATTGVYQSPDWGYADHFGIAVRDNWAIFAAGYGGVHVVDISDPANPTLASEYEVGTQRQLGAVEIDGDLVRIGWSGGNLTNLSFQNPPNLTLVGNVPIGGLPAMTIATTDEGITHVANATHTVVDNADPEKPARLIRDLVVRSIDLVVKGDYVYTTDRRPASSGGGFYVRDISGDPASPMTVWYFPMESGQTVAKSGSRVFFTAKSVPGGGLPESVLYQFDASNPASPVFLNYLRLEGTQNSNELGAGRDGCLDLLAENGVLYATTVEGLAIIQVGGPRRPRAATSILGE